VPLRTEVTVARGLADLASQQMASPGAVIGLFIWARIDDQRQRSFVTGYSDRPPGFQDHEDIRGSMHAGRRQRVADGGQTSVLWRLSRSVIDSVGPAGAEFARNADSVALNRPGEGLRATHRTSSSGPRRRYAVPFIAPADVLAVTSGALDLRPLPR
jgi:hypothetical protein